jgi:hypothetical protein
LLLTLISNRQRSNHDVIGSCEISLQTVVANRGRETVLELKKEKHQKPGTLMINVEQIYTNNSVISCVVAARDLKKGHRFAQNWPYFMIAKSSESGRNLPVYRSENFQKCRGGQWKGFELPLNVLCNGDYSMPIKIDF